MNLNLAGLLYVIGNLAAQVAAQQEEIEALRKQLEKTE